MSDLDKATFRASFPPIQSAIKIYGNEEGARIQFEIPESDMVEATKLLLMRGMALRVTVEPLPKDEYAGKLK